MSPTTVVTWLVLVAWLAFVGGALLGESVGECRVTQGLSAAACRQALLDAAR